jgi:hypothetical protein
MPNYWYLVGVIVVMGASAVGALPRDRTRVVASATDGSGATGD